MQACNGDSLGHVGADGGGCAGAAGVAEEGAEEEWHCGGGGV